MSIMELGNITLYNNDCFNVLSKLELNSIDMVFADLPYGTTQCKWDKIIDLEIMWNLLRSISKIKTPYIFTAREPFTSILVSSNIKFYHHKWVWNKKQSGSFQTAKYMPLQIEEDIVVFGKTPHYYPIMRTGKMRAKGGAKRINREQVASIMENGTPLKYNDQYYPTNIIELANPRTGNVHPTQKPVELLEYLIRTYTDEGDTVLDPTMGSGTTAVACTKLNRKCIGIEKDTKYFDIAVNRVLKEMI